MIIWSTPSEEDVPTTRYISISGKGPLTVDDGWNAAAWNVKPPAAPRHGWVKTISYSLLPDYPMSPCGQDADKTELHHTCLETLRRPKETLNTKAPCCFESRCREMDASLRQIPSVRGGCSWSLRLSCRSPCLLPALEGSRLPAVSIETTPRTLPLMIDRCQDKRADNRQAGKDSALWCWPRCNCH